MHFCTPVAVNPWIVFHIATCGGTRFRNVNSPILRLTVRPNGADHSVGVSRRAKKPVHYPCGGACRSNHPRSHDHIANLRPLRVPLSARLAVQAALEYSIQRRSVVNSDCRAEIHVLLQEDSQEFDLGCFGALICIVFDKLDPRRGEP